MSFSRAELQSMDRDELVEAVVGLSQTVDDLQAEVKRQTEVRADIETETIPPIFRRLTKVENAIEELEAENDRLRERLDDGDAGGKDQKVADIVEHAQNRRSGEAVVQLTAKEIKGATGCSRRYAYDLMDDENLPGEYGWILARDDIKQYGDLEIKKEDGARRIGIDFEGVHSAGCPVNKFTTGPAGEEGP